MKKGKEPTTLDEVKKAVTFVQYEIRRPFVFVKAEAFIDGSEWTGLGFAKVCWPDEWNLDTGIKIAERKAVEQITKAIGGTRFVQRVLNAGVAINE